MLKNAFSAAVVFAVVLVLSSSNARADEGWTDLLPDNNLSKHWTTKGNWSVDDDGVISLTPREGEKGWSRFDAYLWLEGEYDDFEFKFDYKVQQRGNSGFYFNVADRASPVAKGIEVQIYDSGSKKEGARLTDHDSGGVIPGVPPKKNAAKPHGEWNSFHIKVQGDQLTVRLNDVVVNEVDLTQGRLSGKPNKGNIGFQDHALPLALRNLKIKTTD